MKLRVRCSKCERPYTLYGQGPHQWSCGHCHLVRDIPAAADDLALSRCVVCENTELYKKKNFPHALGLSILAAAAIGFVVLHGLYFPRAAWAILIGSAIVDGVLYLAVGDVIVCYRCGAEYRGVASDAIHQPFELVTAERYRQERLRREQA